MSFDRSLKKILVVLPALILMALAACSSISKASPSPEPTPVVSTETPFPSFILHIPDKALWKNYLTVSAETSAGTACRLTYVPPMGKTQEMDTIANENGLCEWRWKISEEEGKGPGRLIFTIDGHSETHFIEIRRSF